MLVFARLVLWAAASVVLDDGDLPVRYEAVTGVTKGLGLQAVIDRPFEEPWKVRVGPKGPERDLASCAQLGLEFPGGTLESIDVADQRPLLSHRAHCRALLWLRDARTSHKSFLGELPQTLDTAGALPEAVIPALGSPRKQARARKGTRTWKVADPKLKLNPSPPPKPGFHLRGRDYHAELAVYGRGDFDRDGVEDVLIRRDASAIGGSYQEFGLFLLTRPAEGAPFKVLRASSEGY